ncbi:MAG: hydrogenobyrinic acid a,c-diamide synthase (glutamine-hydrolyzing) [Desulfobacteraceae bacterium]|nr:hydrogenobyrinic acid a,c-diamide synthase (glutamine-hydrolyzing) [Desulfobacteraceae bacterium]
MLKKEGCSSVITIAGLRGGSGKTFVSLGLVSSLKSIGKNVCPFKKGPDYIDAGWLAFAAGRHCYNLDTYMCSPEIVKESFVYHSSGSDFALVEGNRGLFDAIDVEGRTSTAEVAKLLNSPVIVCIDCTKCTMTIAAIVMGLRAFDPELKLSGVIFNKVAGPRHAGKLTKAVEHYTDVKVIGAIPKVKKFDFPERHMGLVPTCENKMASSIIEETGKIITENLDLDKILKISKSDNPCISEKSPYEMSIAGKTNANVNIGVIIDDSFQFYYPENIVILEKYGAKLIRINAMEDQSLPEDLHALYIGGGFPESFAGELEANKTMRESVRAMAMSGLPVYAECGGLMYLGKSIILGDREYEMCSFFDMSFTISKKPQGHGYVDAIVTKENPFMDKGTHIKGHEFRYSKIVNINSDDCFYSYELDRGVGIEENMDGITKKNTIASYVHLHTFGTPVWAEAMIKAALKYKNS